MSQFWSSIVNDLTPYVPGEQPKVDNLIKLNTNENPYPPSPNVLEVLKKTANNSLRLYPDPNADQLKQSLANYYQLKSDQIFVGNGSDEVLAHTFVALLKQDKPILLPDISYSFYPVYCQLFAVDYQQIPLDQNFQIDINDYIPDANIQNSALENNGGIIFPNPNAPTGQLLSLQKIEMLLQKNKQSVVVIDEAYIDFGGESAVKLIDTYANLLVIQTFSKSRSLAGLRVGFAMGNSHLIEALERVKNSFNSYPLDQFAINGATAAIEDNGYFKQTIDKIISSRGYLIAEMESMGFQILPSSANFIFVSHPDYRVEELALFLRQQGIIVRHFKQQRIEQYLRITIGTQIECEALVKTLNKYI
ncbi:MAG: histidinol-phosphate transaminase [Pseudomonadota bacterium]